MFHRALVLLFAVATFSVSAAPRAIPGITAKDTFPAGCVGCHVKVPDGDMRLSVMLTKLKKKHPAIKTADIPASCAKCHAKSSKIALAPIIHREHFGADQSLFLTKFGGECTHCHKLDRRTGAWSMPSGAEK